jgi:hypothetical protein
MSISHTAQVTLNEPRDQVDLEAWLFGLSDSDYQASAKGHRGAGVSRAKAAGGSELACTVQVDLPAVLGVLPGSASSATFSDAT